MQPIIHSLLKYHNDKYNFWYVKSKHFSLLQDGSTNSSPVFSSAENSFDKSKLVVRDLFPNISKKKKKMLHNARNCGYGWIIGQTSLWWYSLLSSRQNSSQSSLDDSFDQFDGSESQSLQDQPLHRPQRGERSTPVVNPLRYVYLLNSTPSQYYKCYLYLESSCMIEKSYISVC